MKKQQTPPTVCRVYWIFERQGIDLVRSFYDQDAAIAWIHGQEKGKAYDIITVTTGPGGERTTRATKTCTGKGQP